MEVVALEQEVAQSSNAGEVGRDFGLNFCCSCCCPGDDFVLIVVVVFVLLWR